MGDIIWGHTFPRNRPEPDQIRDRSDAVDHLASELSKMLDEGDTLMVLECQNGETLEIHNTGSAKTSANYNSQLGRSVEMPADCPA